MAPSIQHMLYAKFINNFIFAYNYLGYKVYYLMHLAGSLIVIISTDRHSNIPNSKLCAPRSDRRTINANVSR